MVGDKYSPAFHDSNPESEIFQKLSIKPEVREELFKEIQRRLAPKPVDIKALFKTWTYSYNGIQLIKAALKAGQDKSTNEIQLEITLKGSPEFEISTRVKSHL